MKFKNCHHWMTVDWQNADCPYCRTTPPRVCGNCRFGKSTSLEDTICFYESPYIQTGRWCEACDNWEGCVVVDNPKTEEN
jgi:hypothetical protein